MKGSAEMGIDMKIVLVKQEVYPDLYICKNRTPIDELLFSSAGRVGPLGLFARLDADFLIVKEDRARECHMWEYDDVNGKPKQLRQLKTRRLNEIEGQEFKIPGSDICQGDLAVSVDEIDWSKYDIVISLNISIPIRILKKYPQVFWVHMSGEASTMQERAYYGYDLGLIQFTTGGYDERRRILEFPYTFLGSDDLEKVVSNRDEFKNIREKSGIYGEINCVRERPVRRIPQFDIVVEKTGEQVRYHKQRIIENLLEIYSSKYYLKIGGRQTRGNGVIEAISLGTPVLMSPDDITHKQILPPEAWVFNQQDAIEKINYYNNNKEAYQKLLQKERELVQMFAFDYPLYGLLKAYNNKQEPNRKINYSYFRYRILRKLKNIL